ncbi:MAG: hypothetical protein WBA23_02350 [Tunicatimonas sp.]|uniref:hypothetical protein n=1 Tax=Tunicatimonas sp. TaxID=1940096 RepID=UPI003C77C794
MSRTLDLCQKAIYCIRCETVEDTPLAPFSKGGKSRTDSIASEVFLLERENLFQKSKNINKTKIRTNTIPPFLKGARGNWRSYLSNFKLNLPYWLIVAIIVGITSCSYDPERQDTALPQQEEPAPAQETPSKESPKSTYATSVYLENSGSMDGYVRGNTQFEDAIYRMLVDLNYWADTLALNYINSRPIPYQQDVSQFISDLEPQEFQQRGGNRGNSDLNKILTQVASRAGQGEVSVLISDFIFSVKGSNTEELLNNQKISLYNTFRQQLAQSPFSTYIIKLSSAFTGSYYDKNDRPLSLNGVVRPYYIWVMGPNEALQSLRQQIDFSGLDGYQTSYLLSDGSASEPPFYTVLSNTLNTGSFRTDRDYASADYVRGIEKVETGRRGETNQFSFAVAMNLTSIPAEESYLTDPYNYQVEGYQLDSIIRTEQIERVHPRDQALIDGKASHVLLVSTEQTNYPDLSIALLKQTPAWVVNTSSTSDTRIQRNEEQQKQTFGLLYLIEGVEEAYEQVFDNQDAYFTATVSVKR